MTVQKYKTHCEIRCMLMNCETREAGGCYCVCRTVDYLHTLESELDGSTFRRGAGFIYVPGRYLPLVGEERQRVLDEIESIKKKLKEWEIVNEN